MNFNIKNLTFPILAALCFLIDYSARANPPSATVDTTLTHIMRLPDDTIKARAFFNYADTSVTFWSQREEQILAALNSFKQLCERLNDQRGTSSYYMLMTWYYDRIGDYAKISDAASKSLELARKSGSRGLEIRALKTSARIYAFTKNYTKALDCYRQAANFYRQANDKKNLSMLLNTIATVYSEEKKYDSALVYSQRALAIAEGVGDKDLLAECYCEVAWDHYRTGQYWMAYRYCKLFFAIENIVQNRNYSSNLNTLGAIYRDAPDSLLPKMGIKPGQRLREAAACFSTALQMARKQSSLFEISLNLRDISDVYARRKDFRQAYYGYKEYIVYRDSLNAEEAQKAIIQQQGRYALGKQADSLTFREQLTQTQLHGKQVQSYYLAGGITILLVLSTVVYRNYRKANFEKRRSNGLLRNILPDDVAEELKQKGSAQARLFDEVTVLFTDFVNFTTISELLTPQELVDELHHCFMAFDEIIVRNRIEKIKTIGDAYLAVSGLPNADPDHAANAIKAAQEILAFIRERKQRLGDRTFDIRIGIHSGSVVAGIVGVKKFAYDIWGDTVNTAARMEQNSEPGKINVSEKTYDLVRDKFLFVYRGEIIAKNKGAMKMYFVH